MTDDQRTIVAVTGEDDRYAPVRSRASAMAAGSPSTVILYDVDAAGVFSSPVPTEWSGEGEQELTPERMGPDELEAQGRKPLADQVRNLRDVGVDAWAWLPTSADASALAEYAERQGAASSSSRRTWRSRACSSDCRARMRRAREMRRASRWSRSVDRSLGLPRDRC